VRPFIAFILCAQIAGAQTLQLPPRPANAPSRATLIQSISSLTREAREESLFVQLMRGNVPAFMRALCPVSSSASIGGVVRSVTYYVIPEYLAVGSNTEYFLAPMTPLLAQKLADTLHCTLPTRKMVNDIYAAASLKLAPAPIAPSAEMITVPVFAQHDSMVWTQRNPQLTSFPLGTLVAGTKKDVILSNRIRSGLKTGVPKPVVIYGWHQLDGTPIQPLYNGHGEGYADYSHGIRLVQEAVQFNGTPSTVSAILKNDTLASILSDEGTIAIPRYGDIPTRVLDNRSRAPEEALQLRNYPNPFNTTTVVSGQSPVAGHVRIAVYDVLGREAAVLIDEERSAGKYETRFDASDHASGVYILRAVAGEASKTVKMLVLK
jgi:hypothetical protein